MQFLKWLIFCVLTIFLEYSCTATLNTVEQQNQSNLYTPGSGFLHPEYVVYHNNDTSSQMLMRIFTDELLFNQANAENTMQAKIKIHYQLFDITTDAASRKIADSATIIRKFDKQNVKRIIVNALGFKARRGKTYSLRITTTDILRKTSIQNLITVNKTTRFSAQNFKVLLHPNDAPLFRGYLNGNEPLHIIANETSTKKLFIKYFKGNTPLPLPPFSVNNEPAFNFITDSLWVFDYNPNQAFLFTYNGLYFIQTDTTQSEGLLLANFGENYPKIKDASEMLKSLSYLATPDDVSKLQVSNNEKLTVDNFWLEHNNNTEMARELIRIYYTRMTYANQYFASYKEGWKTDRGMIYMLFGPPKYISKAATTETWEYYVPRDGTNLTINFIKNTTPYSENHYTMAHSEIYARYWQTAVDTWRNGKVFSIEE